MKTQILPLALVAQIGIGAVASPWVRAQVPSVPTPMPSRTTPQDEHFIKQLSQEIGVSYLVAQAARNRATRPAVRELGVQVAAGLQQIQQDVTTLAIRKDVILSNTLEATNQSLVDSLSSASLDEFDSKYLETLLQYLPTLQASCEAIARSTADADLKAYAQKVAPILQDRIGRLNAVRRDL